MTNIKLLKTKRVADTWRHLDKLGYEVCPLTGEIRVPSSQELEKMPLMPWERIEDVTNYPPDDPSA